MNAYLEYTHDGWTIVYNDISQGYMAYYPTKFSARKTLGPYVSVKGAKVGIGRHKDKEKRGGVRKGAGRPPSDDALQSVTFRLRTSDIEALDKAAKSVGGSRSDVLRLLIEHLFDEIRGIG